MINITTYTKGKGSSSSSSSSSSGGYGYVSNVSVLEQRLDNLTNTLNDWFSFDNTNNAVKCNYDFYSGGSVSALGYGGGGQPSPPQQQYITSGLVFHLDGLNKGENADAWTDLVGGIVFTNNGAVATPNGWLIYNSSSSNSLRNTDADLSWSMLTSTIEVVYTTARTTVQIGFLPKTDGAIAFGFRNATSGESFYISNYSSSANNKVLTSPIAIRGTHTVSLNINGGLIDLDNALTATKTNAYLAHGTYNEVGARDTNTTYSFNGNIYSIRIYNRLLTESEMRHNQLVDNQRFSLNLSEE